ncbi:hypothetical protein CNMCM6106_004968 [Aspergillus hiratsukae]|uniref:HNH nuclease domain-containing protein n=1 Tax=Aspergillus hiratsukae TaxID=1194566 RepID=A0A8H6PQ82_9EURO|nr:hypothetical protein CNMCM6106_004968 [Aspergillus hiratsukae]
MLHHEDEYLQPRAPSPLKGSGKASTCGQDGIRRELSTPIAPVDCMKELPTVEYGEEDLDEELRAGQPSPASKFPLKELIRLHVASGILVQEVPEFPVFSVVKGMSQHPRRDGVPRAPTNDRRRVRRGKLTSLADKFEWPRTTFLVNGSHGRLRSSDVKMAHSQKSLGIQRREGGLAGGNSPDVTASPLDVEMTVDDIAAELDESCRRKEQLKLKDMCLKRDDHRCVLTGVWDLTAKNLCPPAERGNRIGDTELAHIIPFSHFPIFQWENGMVKTSTRQAGNTCIFPGMLTAEDFRLLRNWIDNRSIADHPQKSSPWDIGAIYPDHLNATTYAQKLRNGPARDLVDKRMATIQMVMQKIRERLAPPQPKKPAKLPPP